MSKSKIYNNVVLTIIKTGRIFNSTALFPKIFPFFQTPESSLRSSSSSGPKSFGFCEASIFFLRSQPLLKRTQVVEQCSITSETLHEHKFIPFRYHEHSSCNMTFNALKQAAETRETRFLCHAQHFPMEGATLRHPDSLLHLGQTLCKARSIWKIILV